MAPKYPFFPKNQPKLKAFAWKQILSHCFNFQPRHCVWSFRNEFETKRESKASISRLLMKLPNFAHVVFHTYGGGPHACAHFIIYFQCTISRLDVLQQPSVENKLIYFICFQIICAGVFFYFKYSCASSHSNENARQMCNLIKINGKTFTRREKITVQL